MPHFWERTIHENPVWFQEHPAREAIIESPDRSKFLALHLFGDDGTLRKSRVMKTVTWMSALHTPLTALHSRIPFYVLPKHIVLDATEFELQSAISWSFHIWLSGLFPSCNHKGEAWPSNSIRAKLAAEQHQIAGGHVGIYTGFVSDELWKKEHFRFDTMYSNVDMCSRCEARSCAGPLNFVTCCPLPERSNQAYLDSNASRRSPLSWIPGYHISTNRPEAMHIGPLGVLPDAVGSGLIELCDEAIWGMADFSPWRLRLGAQLAAAYAEFYSFCKNSCLQHTIKRFSCAGFSVQTLSGSWPAFKGKAHNCLVLCSWLACKAREVTEAHPSEYSNVRAQVFWAWKTFFEICSSADPDWLNAGELASLDACTKVLILGSNKLAQINSALSKPRWKIRPKLHSMWHLNSDCQQSGRNPKCFWSFKDEEMMGKLSRIAGAVHAVSLHNRSLERWCLQFFSFMMD